MKKKPMHLIQIYLKSTNNFDNCKTNFMIQIFIFSPSYPQNEIDEGMQFRVSERVAGKK